MLKRFYPKEIYKSTYDIDFRSYYERGYRGVIFDIDNTLVPHNADIDDVSIEFIKELKQIGYKICLLSNNDEQRVSGFSNKLGVDFIHKAWKPSRKGYVKAMNVLGTNLNNTLFVGDQIFTDVWGANRSGIYSLLVRPLNPKEEIQIVLKRIPEKYIISRFEKNISKNNRKA